MSESAERIMSLRKEIFDSVTQIKNQITPDNADTCTRLTAVTIEGGMCIAAFEIAVQLAELNENLETVIDRQRGKIRIDTFQV